MSYDPQIRVFDGVIASIPDSETRKGSRLASRQTASRATLDAAGRPRQRDASAHVRSARGAL
jgi:hypothetical protein